MKNILFSIILGFAFISLSGCTQYDKDTPKETKKCQAGKCGEGKCGNSTKDDTKKTW